MTKALDFHLQNHLQFLLHLGKTNLALHLQRCRGLVVLLKALDFQQNHRQFPLHLGVLIEMIVFRRLSVISFRRRCRELVTIVGVIYHLCRQENL